MVCFSRRQRQLGELTRSRVTCSYCLRAFDHSFSVYCRHMRSAGVLARKPKQRPTGPTIRRPPGTGCSPWSLEGWLGQPPRLPGGGGLLGGLLGESRGLLTGTVTQLVPELGGVPELSEMQGWEEKSEQASCSRESVTRCCLCRIYPLVLCYVRVT